MLFWTFKSVLFCLFIFKICLFFVYILHYLWKLDYALKIMKLFFFTNFCWLAFIKSPNDISQNWKKLIFFSIILERDPVHNINAVSKWSLIFKELPLLLLFTNARIEIWPRSLTAAYNWYISSCSALFLNVICLVVLV